MERWKKARPYIDRMSLRDFGRRKIFYTIRIRLLMCFISTLKEEKIVQITTKLLLRGP
jgi:hypothetical protein